MLTRQGFCLCFVLFSSIFRGGATALCWGRCAACLGYYDAFATNGRAALRVESGCSPRKALPTALRSGCAAALSSSSVGIIAAGPSGVNKHAIHDYVCIAGDGFFSRWDGRCGAALGCCCAARTSVLQVTCWGARKTHAMISPFRSFFERFLLLLMFLGVRFDCRESAVFLCVHRSKLIGVGGRGRLLLNGELSILFRRHPC